MHAKRDPPPGRNIASARVKGRESALFLALILLMTVIGIAAPNFLGTGNLYLVSRQISFVAIVALGELFVILTGGIDLSVGSVMALAGMGGAYVGTVYGLRGEGGCVRDDDRGPAAVCGTPWDSRRARHGSGEWRTGRVRRDRALHRDARDALVRLGPGALAHQGLAHHRRPRFLPAHRPGRLSRVAHPRLDRGCDRPARPPGAQHNSVRTPHLRHRRQ